MKGKLIIILIFLSRIFNVFGSNLEHNELDALIKDLSTKVENIKIEIKKVGLISKSVVFDKEQSCLENLLYKINRFTSDEDVLLNNNQKKMLEDLCVSVNNFISSLELENTCDADNTISWLKNCRDTLKDQLTKSEDTKKKELHDESKTIQISDEELRLQLTNVIKLYDDLISKKKSVIDEYGCYIKLFNEIGRVYSLNNFVKDYFKPHESFLFDLFIAGPHKVSAGIVHNLSSICVDFLFSNIQKNQKIFFDSCDVDSFKDIFIELYLCFQVQVKFLESKGIRIEIDQVTFNKIEKLKTELLSSRNIKHIVNLKDNSSDVTYLVAEAVNYLIDLEIKLIDAYYEKFFFFHQDILNKEILQNLTNSNHYISKKFEELIKEEDRHNWINGLRQKIEKNIELNNATHNQRIITFSKEENQKIKKLYGELLVESSQQLRKRLGVIKSGSYLDSVLRGCDELEEIYFSNDDFIKKIDLIKEKIASDENVFFKYFRHFMEDPFNQSKLQMMNKNEPEYDKIKYKPIKKLFGIEEQQENDVLRDENYYIEKLIPIICFIKYLYCPFALSSDILKKHRRAFGNVLHSDKGPYAEIFADFNELVGRGENYQNNIFDEGMQIFNNFCSSVGQLNNLTNLEKQAVYNLTKHNSRYLANFLSPEIDNYEKMRRKLFQSKKKFNLVYNYIARPLLSTGLKKNFQNEQFTEKVIKSLIMLAPDDALDAVDSMLINLENSGKVSDNFKNVLFCLRTKKERLKEQRENNVPKNSCYNIWQKKASDMYEYVLGEKDYNIDYYFTSNFLNLVQYDIGFFENYLDRCNLENNNTPEELLKPLDEYTQSSLKDNNTIKNTHDTYNSTWWKSRIVGYFFEPIGNRIRHVLEQKALEKGASLFAAWKTGDDQQVQWDDHVKQLHKNSGDMELELSYDFITLTHKDPNSLYAQKVFKEINKKYTEPKKDRNFDKTLMEIKLRKLQGG